MASIDNLPADQRAVLELVLRRGRTYDEIAALLSIDRAGVRQRALAAFDALGPKTRVAANRRALIADYLLEALPSGVADEVREHLKGSASERAWARAIASELEGLSDHPLPEIPANGSVPRAKPGGRDKAAATSPKRGKSRAEVPVAAALSNGTPRAQPTRISRRGGAVLLGAVAAVAIALVLVFVVFSGGGAVHRALHPRHTVTATTGGTPKLISQINLHPPGGGKSPVGIADVVSVRNQIGMLIVAGGLKPNTKHPPNYYGIWLYNSPTDDHFLGVVTPPVGSNGVFRVPAALPSDASRFQKLIVTLETGVPKHAVNEKPGQVLLQGAGKL